MLTDFLNERRKRKLLGGPGACSPVNVIDFNSLKSPFSRFRVTQIGYWPVPFTLDKALQLGKFFIY